MAIVTMRQMLDSGVHFGHQTRRWNPKMKRFILTERNGIYIIDLAQTVSHTDAAYTFVKNTVAKGGSILFVGTKKQAQEAVAEQAARVGMPYVNQRWLGGMLTNFQTVSKRLARLKELEEMDLDDASTSAFTKKELLMMRRERDKLARTLGGIRTMSKVPAAVWIVDTKKEHLAVDEARKLGLPIVAILDTNADPDEVDFAIPGNDDAIRSVALLTRVIADAVADGLLTRHAKAAEDDAEAAPEPMAEWERELLAGSGAPEASDAAESGDSPLVAAAVASADTATVAARLDTTDAEELAAPDAVDPAKSFPAATPDQKAAVDAAAAGALKGVEVTAESAQTPATEPIAKSAEPAKPVEEAKAPAQEPKSAAPAKPAEAPAKAEKPAAPAKESKPAAAAAPAKGSGDGEKPAKPAARESKPAAPAKESKPAEEPAKAEKPAEEPAKAEKPAAPAKPAKAEKPAAPAKGSGDAEKPAKPAAKESKPAEPARAEKPAEPAKAEKPTAPAKESKAAKPAKAEKPAEAAKPEEPAKAEKPAAPAKETKPARPAKAAKAEKPAAKADKPAEEPAKETKPAKADKPAAPAKESKPAKADEPAAKPAKADKPAEAAEPAKADKEATKPAKDSAEAADKPAD
jgi:small subunit ribosomal protein S2